jgi:xanthine dehydrogenase accessory factor
LRFCADGPAYVGLLGPIARRDALLAELGAAAERLRPRLHAPVGLDLGGSGPEAIALAIAAELQQVFAKR